MTVDLRTLRSESGGDGEAAGTAPASRTATKPSLRLLVDDDELNACVACGLCLPHCPTYRVTQEEIASPRGRIAAMRAVQWEGAPADAAFVEAMDACVQCRGCETACPSGVQFGRLMEGTRAALAGSGRLTPRWQRLAYRVLGHRRLLQMGSRALAMAQRARLVPSSLGLPRLPLRQRPLRETGNDAWLFTGCVMDAWQRHTHEAVLRVLAAAGVGVQLPLAGGDCCGALHVHAGLVPAATKLARKVQASMPGGVPIVVDSAGCGAQLKDYGHLMATPGAARFSARVFDVHEFLATRLEALPSPPAPSASRPQRDRLRVAVQDPCHLRHVQKAHLAVRVVLSRYVDVVELDDEGLCCGAGGAYSALHPDIAADIRARKLAAIERSGAALVASANPGCSLHLAAAGVNVKHPLEIVDAVLRGCESELVEGVDQRR